MRNTEPQSPLEDLEEEHEAEQKHSLVEGTPNSLGRKLRNPKASPTARSNHDLHRIWANMKQRCYNPNNTHYDRYGGRRIAVCSRWMEFVNFVEDMGSRPSSKHTLERKDNDKGYSKENCRWATRKEQSRNTTRNHIINCGGRSLTLSEWAEDLGVSFVCILNRLKRGWSVERAVTIKSQRR